MNHDNAAHQSEHDETVEEALELQHDEASADPVALAQQEAAEFKDKYLRAVAEMQNIQKRAQRDVEDAMKYSVSSAAKPLLSVADNLARALNAAPNDLDERAKNILEGVRATERELLNALERMNVVKVAAATGQPLNPHEHEVMFEVSTEDHAHGTIVQVLEEGYKIHDRLLRPARVSVAKNTGSTEKEVDFSA